jgi:hypothetical protein
MFYSKSLQDASIQRIQVPHDQQKYDESQEPQSWLSDYLQEVKYLGHKENSHAKPPIKPHQGNTVMVRQTQKRNNRELGRARQAI